MAFKIEDEFFSQSRFPNLTKLDLNNAQIVFNDTPFVGLNKLERLRLDSNDLSRLPCKNFQDMTNLRSLNLSSNKIQKISTDRTKCLQNLKSINSLSLNSNELTGKKNFLIHNYTI